MTWDEVQDERDDYGALTPLALAIRALVDQGCSCKDNNRCLPCLCEDALRAEWQRAESLAVVNKLLRNELRRDIII